MGSPEAGEVQRRILHTKVPIRRVYERMYRRMWEVASGYIPNVRVALELGSGGGFVREIVPEVRTSDVRPLQGLDLVLDAQALPLRDGSVDVLLALWALHHLPRVRSLFTELERVLTPGGVLVAVEPYWSPLARLAYQRFHPEDYDEHAPTWEFASTNPMSGNQALSYLLLERDREEFAAAFPGLEVIRLEAFDGPSYLLTGGLWKRALLPASWLARLADYEEAHSFWRSSAALHHLFVIRRLP